MRKLSLFVLALFAANLGFAQKGLEIGVEFTPAVTFILNDEDFAEGKNLNFQGTFGFNTGLNVGYNFNAGLGLASGILYSSQGQNYITDYDNVSKADQNTFARKLSYIRVPLLLKFNSDPTASSGSYFRVGPHFDFLSGARYTLDDKSLFNLDQDINLLKDSPYDGYDIYRGFVFGVTMEFGGSANINENMKITFMLHLSGNLNSEDVDAARIYPSNPSTSSTFGRERSGAFNVMGGLNVGFRYTIPME
jgi:hypothetical protein